MTAAGQRQPGMCIGPDTFMHTPPPALQGPGGAARISLGAKHPQEPVGGCTDTQRAQRVPAGPERSESCCGRRVGTHVKGGNYGGQEEGLAAWAVRPRCTLCALG